jgi:hypothetical protein
MSEQPFHPSGSSAAGSPGDWREETTPSTSVIRGDAVREPGYGGAAPHGGAPAYSTTPEYSTAPVPVRRPDTLAALLLLLAGICAGVSLLLTWLPGVTLTGWDLVHRGISTLTHGVRQVFDDGLWQPLAIVLGGGLLFLLGLLLLIPARAHRLLGLLALLVSLGAGAGVLVPLSDAGWHLSRFGVGFWFAAAVAVLGVLGSLKALLTRPKQAAAGPAV